MDGLIAALVAAVGERDVLVDDDLRASYETDFTRRFHGRARAVVRPGSADEVAAVLVVCREHGAAVVPQGGNTGMVGASVPRGGEGTLGVVTSVRWRLVPLLTARVAALVPLPSIAAVAHLLAAVRPVLPS